MYAKRQLAAEIKDAGKLNRISYVLPRKTEGVRTRVAVVPWKARFEEVKKLRSIEIARETVRKGGYRGWPNMKTVWTGHPIGGFSSPMITPNSEDEIEEAMVFTVEPGSYTKGKGGVRIEHHVLAKKCDYEILDKYPQS